MKIFVYLAAIFISLQLSGCPSIQQNRHPLPVARKAEAPYTHSASGTTFPGQVGDFL